MSKHKRAKRSSLKNKQIKESNATGNKSSEAAGSQVAATSKKFPWLYYGSIIPYTEHRCFEPKQDQTKHIEWRAKEAAMWAGKCILRLNELRAGTVGSITESDNFSQHYCSAVEAIFREEEGIKKKFYELVQMLEKADHSNAVCEVMLQVSLLFMGHDGLVVGFEYFLPQELTMIMLLVQQKAAIGAAIASDPQCLNRLPELHKHIDNAVRNAVNQFKELTPKPRDVSQTATDSTPNAGALSSVNVAGVGATDHAQVIPSAGHQASSGPAETSLKPGSGGEKPQAQDVGDQASQGASSQPQAQQAPMILQAIPGANTGQVYFMSQPGNQMTLGYAIPSAIQYVQQIPGQNQQFITYGAPAAGQQAQQYTNGMQFTTQGQHQQPQVQYVFTGSIPANSAQMFNANGSSNSSPQQQQNTQHTMTQLSPAIGSPASQFMPQAFTIIQTPAAGNQSQQNAGTAQFASSMNAATSGNGS